MHRQGGPVVPASGGRQAGPPPSGPRGVRLDGELLLALGVLGLAVFFFTGALQIRVSPGYAHIGPRFFPFLVSGGLAACGVALLVEALRKRPASPEKSGSDRLPINWGAVLVMALALFIQQWLMERAGFVVASTLLFWGVALAFGSRRYVRDGLIGLALAVAVYLAFTRLLDLNLPGGWLAAMVLRMTGGA